MGRDHPPCISRRDTHPGLGRGPESLVEAGGLVLRGGMWKVSSSLLPQDTLPLTGWAAPGGPVAHRTCSEQSHCPWSDRAGEAGRGGEESAPLLVTGPHPRCGLQLCLEGPHTSGAQRHTWWQPCPIVLFSLLSPFYPLPLPPDAENGSPHTPVPLLVCALKRPYGNPVGPS